MRDLAGQSDKEGICLGEVNRRLRGGVRKALERRSGTGRLAFLGKMADGAVRGLAVLGLVFVVMKGETNGREENRGGGKGQAEFSEGGPHSGRA